MEITRDIFKFLHVFSIIFMSAPFYSLIVVNERGRLGGSDFKVDRYLENMIRGQAMRCYVFQLTALFTGVMLIVSSGMGIGSIMSNPVLLLKTLNLFLLMGLLSVVHFSLQPGIERILSEVKEGVIPPEVSARMLPLRLKRKKLAALCLFLVISEILLGMQVYASYHPAIDAAVLVLAALFSWRVYKRPVSYGWL